MTHKKKTFLSRLFSSSRLSMLASTMFGVIAGIYLTSYFEKRQLSNDQKEAMELVKKELVSNEEDLQAYHDLLKEKFHAFTHVIKWLDMEEEEFLMPKDSLDNFINQTQSIFTYASSDPRPNNQISVHGELDITIEPGSTIMLTGLARIVWDTYKQTNFLSVTDFNCMTNLETMYLFQNDVDEINREWMDSLFSRIFFKSKEASEKFLNTWNTLILKQQLLLELYNTKNDMLQECN